MNIRLILDKFSPCYVPAGEVVIRQGEVGDCCYFIKEGAVDVYQSVDGKTAPVKVNELGVGRCFGEDALVNETVRNASIEMQQNGVLMKLSKADFFLLLKQPKVATLNLSEAQSVVDEGGAFIDVRTEAEFDQGHLNGALHMPLNLLKLKSRLLDKSKHYVLYCNTGRRSEAAAHLLGQEGFTLSAVKSGVDLTC
jgi:rhodanese-related sulfurtransferase